MNNNDTNELQELDDAQIKELLDFYKDGKEVFWRAARFMDEHKGRHGLKPHLGVSGDVNSQWCMLYRFVNSLEATHQQRQRVEKERQKTQKEAEKIRKPSCWQRIKGFGFGCVVTMWVVCMMIMIGQFSFHVWEAVR